MSNSTNEPQCTPEEIAGPGLEIIGTGFNLGDLVLPQNFAESAGVQKLVTTIPVRKPDKHHFFRVNPDSSHQITVATIDLKVEREVYILHPRLVPSMVTEVKYQKLFVGITRQKVLFLWPVGLPGADGRSNPWHESAMDAAQRAMHNWVRIAANLDLGAYDVYQAMGDLGEPEWPEISIDKIIEIAFKGKVITTMEHPVLQQLRGEV